jgi:hypothetical protein
MYQRFFKPALRILVVLILISIGIGVLAMSIADTGNAAHKDFIATWAAGQLLLKHANPYDAAAVFALEKSVGFTEAQPLVMRNPPYALVLAVPLGLVGANSGVVIWSVMIAAALMLAVHVLWVMHGRQTDRLHLLLYVFAPALACMQLGQTSTFMLLGLALFLSLHERRPFAAGLALPLFFFKPHLGLVLGIVLAMWIVSRRAWRVAAGAAVSVLAGLALALWFDPNAWRDFLPVLNHASAETVLIPTNSSLVRVWLFGGAAWSQYALTLAAALWAVVYYARNRRDWDWNRHGLTLVMVSVWAAPYAWFTDEVIMAPAMLHAFYRAADRRGLLMIFGACDLAALGLIVWGVTLGSGAYIWTSTAWLAWYLAAMRPARVTIPRAAADMVPMEAS